MWAVWGLWCVCVCLRVGVCVLWVMGYWVVSCVVYGGRLAVAVGWAEYRRIKGR